VVDGQWLARWFEGERPRLEAVAYRMLGSRSDAGDAVQEAWLRLSRGGGEGVANLPGWLTTVVARVCLDMLRQRAARREQPLGVRLPDPVIEPWPAAGDPGQQAAVADAVGLALLVVLDTLSPAERLAFVLHDVFAVPFATVAAVLERSPAAAKMLASRARRRVQGAPVPDADLGRQREVVDAFFAAAREGDFDALVGVLAPGVVMRGDGGTARPGLSKIIRGAGNVAAMALPFARLSPFVRPALINQAAGAVVIRDGRFHSVMAFTVTGGKIAAIDIFADPARLARITPERITRSPGSPPEHGAADHHDANDHRDQNDENGRRGTHEGLQRTGSGIGVKSDDPDVHDEVVDDDAGEGEQRDHRGTTATPARGEASVQVAGVHQPDDERPGLLRIPAPVAAPGRLGPDGTGDHGERPDREGNRDHPVGELVEDLRCG
jgi:RNA polymerase sigma-70 factor (ECF subfamily)